MDLLCNNMLFCKMYTFKANKFEVWFGFCGNRWAPGKR